jgi:hypothetical protein
MRAQKVTGENDISLKRDVFMALAVLLMSPDVIDPQSRTVSMSFVYSECPGH